MICYLANVGLVEAIIYFIVQKTNFSFFYFFCVKEEITWNYHRALLKHLFKEHPEFIYPSSWVGDQRLLYREAEKSEYERSLDPPPLTNSTMDRRRRNVNEPLVAFGPPGSSGELNVSVIVSSVPPDFSWVAKLYYFIIMQIWNSSILPYYSNIRQKSLRR